MMSDPNPVCDILDARGLTCPLPVLRARKKLQGLPVGAILDILATDPSSVADFRNFCRQTGDTLLESVQDAEGVWHHRVRKTG
ncbi:sulfurtransferase TusA family protein [Pararhodospirillum photometricum]|nr:sulfurtransferase TusA family protein [Pararhodospirillum photometricum]